MKARNLKFGKDEDWNVDEYQQLVKTSASNFRSIENIVRGSGGGVLQSGLLRFWALSIAWY